MMRARSLLTPLTALTLAVLLLAGCAAEAPPPPLTGVVIPVRDTAPKPPPPREAPPASGQAKPYHFPKVGWADLPGGLRVATIPSKALPIAQVRVVIGGGRAADGEKPGLAALTAQLLRDGGAGPMSSRELTTRIASLGAELTVDTGFDATTLGLAVTRDRLGEALDLLGALVQKPQLSPVEFDKLKKRQVERLTDAARTRGAWGASMVLYRDLFSLPSEHHPYASFGPTVDEVARITVADCRAFHRRYYTARNTFVVVAGDAAPDAARALVQKAFTGFAGGDAPAISFVDPVPPDGRKVTLVDRPKSAQSDVFVGALGPARTDRAFAAFAVENQILGGGAAGRLFADVREKRGLAYAAATQVTELAHGPSVLIAHAGTQTAKTGLALEALLDALGRTTQTAPDLDEVEAAQRFLSDGLAVRLDTIGAVADELVHLHTLGLPDDHDDGYRKELNEITPAVALKAATDHLRVGHEVIVVVGDAAVIGPMLSHFGEVKVVDPTRDFARIRTIPMDGGAALEVPRSDGR
jgi:zinc protease